MQGGRGLTYMEYGLTKQTHIFSIIPIWQWQHGHHCSLSSVKVSNQLVDELFGPQPRRRETCTSSFCHSTLPLHVLTSTWLLSLRRKWGTRSGRWSLLILISRNRIFYDPVTNTRFLICIVVLSSLHSLIAIPCKHRWWKASRRQTSSSHKIHVSQAYNKTENTATQHAWPFNFSKISVRRCNCFSPANASLALDILVLAFTLPSCHP